MSLSHKAAQALGWSRVDQKPWRKVSAIWKHVSGWRLSHCGHPTANYPWALYDPAGRMHLGGSVDGEPTFGMAWRDCLAAMQFVAQCGASSVAKMDAVERSARRSEIRRSAA